LGSLPSGAKLRIGCAPAAEAAYCLFEVERSLNNHESVFRLKLSREGFGAKKGHSSCFLLFTLADNHRFMFLEVDFSQPWMCFFFFFSFYA
jgi:hypothetical protein